MTNTLTRRLGPVFPDSFKRARFYRIANNPDADAVLAWTGANIKLVKTLRYNNGPADGLANTPSSPASIILIHTLPDVAGPHEWCHTLGIDHRGSGANYGPMTNALMNPVNYSDGVKINRYEKGFFP